MKSSTYIFILAVMTGISCSDPADSILVDKLFETNRNLGAGVYSRYSYTDNKVDQITYISDNFESQFLKLNYINDADLKIRTVKYNIDIPTFQQTDTLIYSDDNLIQIIKTTKENGLIKKRDTTHFAYDRLNNLIKARNQSGRNVEFLDYENNNFNRVKYYYHTQLQFELVLKYDNKLSPFKELGYLNFVVFNNSLLEELERLTDNNIIQSIGTDYQYVVFKNIYDYKYKYDVRGRPTAVTTTREGDTEFKIEEFYRYK